MNIRFYNARILTLREDETFEITEGELWVKNDRIIYVGDGEHPTDILIALGGEPICWEREIDCGRNLLMPGFKNAHAHTYMTFLRSFADDLPLQDWLYQYCFPMEEKLTPENIRPMQVLGIMEYLTCGITASFDMGYFPQVYAEVASGCGFRTVQVSGVNSFGGGHPAGGGKLPEGQRDQRPGQLYGGVPCGVYDEIRTDGADREAGAEVSFPPVCT